MTDNTHQDLITDINARVARLEKKNRRLTILAVATTLGALVVVTAGALPAQVPEKIEAKKFVLLSSEGKRIGEMGASPIDNTPHIHLYDSRGRVGLALDDNGVQIAGEVGNGPFTTNGRIFLSRDPNDGDCSLLFTDDQGRSRMQIGVTAGSIPSLQIWDKTLKERIILTLDPKSDAALVSFEQGNNPKGGDKPDKP